MAARVFCPALVAAMRMYHLPMKPAVPGKPSNDNMHTASAKASQGRWLASPARSSINTSLSPALPFADSTANAPSDISVYAMT